MVRKSFLIWLAIIPLAILNGVFREIVVSPLIGERYGQPLSGISLCLIIFVICCVFIPKLGKGSAGTYWKIGFLWILLTVLFEFGFGLLTGDTIWELIKAYDIRTGNLWSLVVLFTGIAPYLTARIRQTIVEPQKAKGDEACIVKTG
jgi:hypothetical protein